MFHERKEKDQLVTYWESLREIQKQQQGMSVDIPYVESKTQKDSEGNYKMVPNLLLARIVVSRNDASWQFSLAESILSRYGITVSQNQQ